MKENTKEIFTYFKMHFWRLKSHFWEFCRSYDPPKYGVYLGGSKRQQIIQKTFFKIENGVLKFVEILCILRKYKGFLKNSKFHFLF